MSSSVNFSLNAPACDYGDQSGEVHYLPATQTNHRSLAHASLWASVCSLYDLHDISSSRLTPASEQPLQAISGKQPFAELRWQATLSLQHLALAPTKSEEVLRITTKIGSDMQRILTNLTRNRSDGHLYWEIPRLPF